MKKLAKLFFITLAFLLIFTLTYAQSPQGFNYQAMAADDYGMPLSNQTVSLQISILQTTISGAAVYVETHSVTTTEHGLISIQVGSGALVSGEFSTIDWGADDYFIKNEIDVSGGSTFTFLGTSQLLSVPFALYADKAGNVNNTDTSATNELQTISISNDTIFLSDGLFAILPSVAAGFDGDYMSLTNVPAYMDTNFTDDFDGDYANLTNQPSIATKVSELANDAGYLTTDTTLTEAEVDAFVANNGYLASFTEVDGSVTNELQTLSISNDTIFLTDGAFAILPAAPAGFDGDYSSLTNVPANMDTDVTDDFDGDYANLTNQPSIATKVSELANDAGYLTTDTTLTEAEVDAYVSNNGYLATEVDGSITNELQTISISNDTIFLTDGAFAILPAAPAGFDGDYSSLTNVPANMDTDATDDFDGQYSNLTGTPTIPTLVTDLANDAGYLTTDTTLTEAEVDAYVSNNGYLATEVDGSITNELQTLSISNDTIFLTNGAFVVLPAVPAGFDGDYSSLTNVPANMDTDATDDFDGQYSNLTGTPTIPALTSDLANDAGFLTTDTTLTEAEVDAYVSNNGYITSAGDLLSSNDLSDLNDAATARTNLGLGTIATQGASTVALTGGTIEGTAIGAVTPASGDFTALATSGAATLNSATITNSSTIGGTLGVTGTTTLTGILNTENNVVFGDAATDQITITSELLGGTPFNFEGTTDDDVYTTFAITDPTVARTITFPDNSGTVAFDNNGITALSTAEIDQLENIGVNTITATQWAYVGAFDQGLTTTSNVSFNNATISGTLGVTGATTLSSSLGVTGISTLANTSIGGSLDVTGDVEVDSASYMYFGDPATDGTWRMGRSGTDLIFERRESSAWVTKITMQP